MSDFYIIHHLDNTLSIEQHTTRPNVANVGPYGSYYSTLSRYMDFTARVDRLYIRTTNQDELMECIDAVTRLVGRKLHVFSAAYPWQDGQWSITLGTSADMTVISFLYADDIDEIEDFLRTEGYMVNERRLTRSQVNDVLNTVEYPAE